MSSNTNRMVLKRPQVGDPFLTQDFFDNFTTLDSYPGPFPCTSGTRPGAWGANQNGMCISETDTGLLWRWDGTKFTRLAPKGVLGYGEISVDFATALTTAQTAISVAVTVPATTVGSTTKRITLTSSMYQVDNGTSTTLGACEVSVRRDPGDVLIKAFLCRGRPSTATSQLDWGSGLSVSISDDPGVSGGSFTYRLCLNSLAAVGGTSTIRATAGSKASLTVKELGV